MISKKLDEKFDLDCIKLDHNVTEDDLKKADAILQDLPPDPIFSYNSRDMFLPADNDKSALKAFTICDRKNRVGIVAVRLLLEASFPEYLSDFEGFGPPIITYVSWIPGKHYSARGVMKMITYLIQHNRPGTTFQMNISPDNVASIKVAETLRAIRAQDGEYIFEGTKHIFYNYQLNSPFWWIQ